MSAAGEGPVSQEADDRSGPMRRLQCPCGESLEAPDDDGLVEKTQAHLVAAHPGLDYSRDEILFLAY